MIYDVSYFIDKFSKIPENKWATISLKKHVSSCAYGHCSETRDLKDSQEAFALSALFLKLPFSLVKFISDYAYAKGLTWKVIAVNDGWKESPYKQPTPKQRILAALYDIKKSQQPLYEDITRELAIFPVEEKEDQPVKEIV